VIAEAALELNEKREAWLNPPDLVRNEAAVVEGYPDRLWTMRLHSNSKIEHSPHSTRLHLRG
jgi:hypothetical protein